MRVSATYNNVFVGHKPLVEEVGPILDIFVLKEVVSFHDVQSCVKLKRKNNIARNKRNNRL